LHTHFNIESFVPERIDVTPDGGGPHDERAVLERTLKPDHCYIKDRGYAKFSLFNDIHNIGSSYVCRLRDNSKSKVVEDRPLTDADRAANVLSDQIVSIGADRSNRARPNHPPAAGDREGHPPTPSRGKYRGGSTGVDCDGYLRLATNLLDVPAEIISVLYQYRWSIEIFFRTFKHLLGCRHLLSHNENGIRIQVLCAIIVLPADQHHDRPNAHPPNHRSAVVPHDGPGQRRGTATATRRVETTRRGRKKTLRAP
jgi:hypothetical protein